MAAELLGYQNRRSAVKGLFVVISVLLLGYSFSALAVCEKDGKQYQTGDKVGPFTCMADGTWKR
jgi:hypothetical protein